MKRLIFPERLSVKVTQEDIDKGRPGLCDKCPVARALQRKGFTAVTVGDEDTGLVCEEGAAGYKNSRRVSEFISTFDNYEECQPFTATFRRIYTTERR